MNIKFQYFLILMVLSGTCGYLLNPNDSAQEFIQTSNELYGEPTWVQGTWTVVQISEYSTYKKDMWDTHPIIHTGIIGSGISYTSVGIDN